MIKKTLTYKNFNNVEVTKDFYFHLSKADMIELAIDGSFEARMKQAIAKEDKLTLFREFKKLIFLAVGVRSEDGENFAKPEMFREAFMTSPAFDQLIEYLFSDTDKAAGFVAGLLPAEAQERALKEIEKQDQESDGKGSTVVVDPLSDEPAWVREDRLPTTEEFRAATNEQKQAAFLRKMTPKS